MGDARRGLFVHESGTPNSLAVVFLDGATPSGLIWDGHMARLVGFRCLTLDFRCLTLDLPGIARSKGRRSARRLTSSGR